MSRVPSVLTPDCKMGGGFQDQVSQGPGKFVSSPEAEETGD